MKIIKHGDPEKLKRTISMCEFWCSKCGCIFEADKTEYEQNKTSTNIPYVYGNCPECDYIVCKEL